MPGSEAAEAELLWIAVERESSRQHPPYDPEWFARLQAARTVPTQTIDVANTTLQPARQRVSEDAADPRAQDWGEAPDSAGFRGRRAELQTLTTLLAQDGARLLLLRGMGGVGKTSLAARISQNLAADFHRVYWRSIRDAPSFSDWSGGANRFSGRSRAHPARQ